MVHCKWPKIYLTNIVIPTPLASPFPTPPQNICDILFSQVSDSNREGVGTNPFIMG